MKILCAAFSLVFLALGGCGGESAVDESTRSEETPSPPPASTEADHAEAEIAEEPPAVEAGPELDLLHAIPTEVAVSTAYRGHESEVGKLFDGDLETAYNSATGSLVGTWIDVRIPEGASVTGIELTAGYTRLAFGGTDVFTGNHRVESVRISRDGEALVTHALDPEARTLQRVPVEGQSGTYRIEVMSVRPGTNADWRETCISELRVLGRAPGAEENTRFPVFALGAVPTRETPPPPSREGFDGRHRQFLHAFARDWSRHESNIIATQYVDTGIQLVDELGGIYRTRRQLLQRLHDFVLPIDAVAADQVRAEMARSPRAEWTDFDEDVDVVEKAFEVMATWGDDPAVRCRTDQLLADIRIQRTATLVSGESMNDEMERLDPNLDVGPDVSVLDEELMGLREGFSRNPRPTTRRILALSLPRVGLESLRLNWNAMRSALETARGTCPWGSE